MSFGQTYILLFAACCEPQAAPAMELLLDSNREKVN